VWCIFQITKKKMAGQFPIHVPPIPRSGQRCAGAPEVQRGGVKFQTWTGENEMRNQRLDRINRMEAVGGPPPMQLPVAHRGLTATQEATILKQIQKATYMLKNAKNIKEREDAKKRIHELMVEKAGIEESSTEGTQSEEPTEEPAEANKTVKREHPEDRIKNQILQFEKLRFPPMSPYVPSTFGSNITNLLEGSNKTKERSEEERILYGYAKAPYGYLAEMDDDDADLSIPPSQRGGGGWW